MTSVLIIAASTVTRAGLAALLGDDSRFTIAGSFLSAAEARLAAETFAPDVVLVEDDDSSGEEFVEFLLTRGEETAPWTPAVVILLSEMRAESVARALASGARAILPRTATGEEIVLAIEASAAGLFVMHPEAFELTGELGANVRDSVGVEVEPNAADGAKTFEALTPREREVLGMLAEGLSNKEIAWRLGISEHTIKFHVSSIFAKLGVSSRTEAATEGLRRGLIML